MASKVKEASQTPPEAFNIYLPTHSDGQLIGAELVETYELGPSHEKPPLGARLQELEYLTGVAHLWEPVEHADTPRGVMAKAAEGKKAVDAAAAASEQAVKDAVERERAEQERADAEAAQERASQEASAKARIAQLLDPEGFAKAQAVAAIEAEHEALAEFATKDEKAELQTIMEERIKAV